LPQSNFVGCFGFFDKKQKPFAKKSTSGFVFVFDFKDFGTKTQILV